jgi:hypothetical protein
VMSDRDPYERGYSHGVRDLLVSMAIIIVALGIIVIGLSLVQQSFGL